MPSWTRQWGEGPLKLLGFPRVLVATAQASRKDIPEVRSWWEGVVSGNAEGWEPLTYNFSPRTPASLSGPWRPLRAGPWPKSSTSQFLLLGKKYLEEQENLRAFFSFLFLFVCFVFVP